MVKPAECMDEYFATSTSDGFSDSHCSEEYQSTDEKKGGMERKDNKVLMTLILLFSPFLVFSGDGQEKLEEYRCFFRKTFLNGNIGEWHVSISEMENLKTRDLDWDVEILKARYGLTGELLSEGKKGEARKLIASTEVMLEQSVKTHPDEPVFYCIGAGLIGFKIGLTPYKAPFYGPVNARKIEKAYSLDPDEPLVWLEKGNSDFYRPKAFGGSKERALGYFRKSVSLFGAEPGCDWIKHLAEAMVFNCLIELGRKEEAIKFRENLVKETGGMKWLGQKSNRVEIQYN